MKSILFVCTIFVLFSCSNEPAVSPDYNPGWQPPVVTGMELTDETSFSFGTFGNPDFPEDVIDDNPESVPGRPAPETLLGMGEVYPNPADGAQTIRFSLSRTSKVKVWVTPAQWMNESDSFNRFASGSNLVNVSNGKAIEVLLDGTEEFSPGIYTVLWDSDDDIPMVVPEGFYRVYVQANGATLWRDIYKCAKFQDCRFLFSNTRVQ